MISFLFHYLLHYSKFQVSVNYIDISYFVVMKFDRYNLSLPYIVQKVNKFVQWLFIPKQCKRTLGNVMHTHATTI